MPKREDTLEDFLAASDSDDSETPKKRESRTQGFASTTGGIHGSITSNQNKTSRQPRSTLLSEKNLASTTGSLFGSTLPNQQRKDTFSSFLERANNAVQKAKEGHENDANELKGMTEKSDVRHPKKSGTSKDKNTKKSSTSEKKNTTGTIRSKVKSTAAAVHETRKLTKTEDFSAFGETARNNPVRESTISMRLSSDDESDNFQVTRSQSNNESMFKDLEHMDSMNTEEFEKEIMKDFQESDFEVGSQNSMSDLQELSINFEDDEAKKSSTSVSLANHKAPNQTDTILNAYSNVTPKVINTAIEDRETLPSSSFNPTQKVVDISEYNNLKKSLKDLTKSKSGLMDELKQLKIKNEDLTLRLEVELQEKDVTIASLKEEKYRVREELMDKLKDNKNEYESKEKDLRKELEAAKKQLHDDRKDFRATMKHERIQWENRIKKIEAEHKKEVEYLRKLSESTLSQQKASDSDFSFSIESNLKAKYDNILKKLQEGNAELQVQLSKQRSSNIELRDQLDELKDELDSRNKKLNRLSETCTSLEENIELLQKEKTDLLSKLQIARQAKNSSVVEDQSNKMSSEFLLNTTQEENKKLTQKVKDLEKIIESMKLKHEKELRTIEQHEEDHLSQTQILEDFEKNATLRENGLKQTIDILNSTILREQTVNNDEISRLRKTIDKLRDEKKDAEREMFEAKRNALQKEQQTILQLENKMQAMEVQHKVEVSSLRNKLQWYAENQELLETQQKRISDLQRYTQELEKKLRRIETDESPDNPLIHKYTDRIKQLEDELEAQKRKQKNPNTISQLIRAAKDDDGPRIQKLNERIKELERLLEQAQQDSQTSLRSLRQESEKVQLQLEQQISNFKKKYNDERKKKEDLEEKLDRSEKSLKREIEKTKELEQAVKDTKSFYRKKFSDIENESKKEKESLSNSRASIDLTTTKRISELENELKVKEMLISRMEKANLVKHPEDTALQTELQQLKNQNIHLKAQNDLLINQRSNWMQEENTNTKVYLKRISEIEKQLREKENELENVKKSKEEALEMKDKIIRETRYSLQDAIDMKEKLIRDYEQQLNDVKRENQITIDKLNRKHSDELMKNSPDERDRDRLRKIDEMLSKISDLENTHRRKEADLKRQINDLKYQIELEQIRSKQTYDVMLQRKNAEVMKFKMALDSLTNDLRRMRQIGYMKRHNPMSETNKSFTQERPKNSENRSQHVQLDVSQTLNPETNFDKMAGQPLFRKVYPQGMNYSRPFIA